MLNQLQLDGFEAYFRGPICAMSAPEFGTLKFRALDFLHYVHTYRIKQTGVDSKHCDYHELLHWAMQDDTATLLQEYIKYLKSICRYKPLTIKHYLECLIKTLDWVCKYKSTRREGQKKIKTSTQLFISISLSTL